jgi:cell division protein FtsB
MQSEIDETDLLKICIARLEVENAKLRKKFAEIEARNAELKARIAKLEDKQLQNEIVKNLLSVSRKT